MYAVNSGKNLFNALDFTASFAEDNAVVPIKVNNAPTIDNFIDL